MLTVRDLQENYSLKKPLLEKRISDFENVLLNSDDKVFFEELVYCILTAGTSARLGLDVIGEIKDLIHHCTLEQLTGKLKGIYRFYNIRSEYIIHTREYLYNNFDMQLGVLLRSFQNQSERRSFFALNKDIKGIGPKEASHFLRNIGYKGYAILDKHILNCLVELGVIESPKPPNSLDKYIEIESKLKNFASGQNINFDELDLLLWSEKTGEILK